MIGVPTPLMFILIVGTIAIFDILSIVSTNKWVDHTRLVLSEAFSAIAFVVDMETGMRGYLLAGKEEFLDPYRNGKKPFTLRSRSHIRAAMTTRN